MTPQGVDGAPPAPVGRSEGQAWPAAVAETATYNQAVEVPGFASFGTSRPTDRGGSEAHPFGSSLPRNGSPSILAAGTSAAATGGGRPVERAGPATPRLPEQPRERAVLSLCGRREVWTNDRSCGCANCEVLR